MKVGPPPRKVYVPHSNEPDVIDIRGKGLETAHVRHTFQRNVERTIEMLEPLISMVRLNNVMILNGHKERSDALDLMDFTSQ